MFRWLGFGGSDQQKQSPGDEEAAPLLTDGKDAETKLQARIYEKLHSYLILAALRKGYLPSTDQSIAQLRSLLGKDVLNPTNTALTPAGRKLVNDLRKLISQLIQLAINKNGEDQLQDFIYCTSRARMGFDVEDAVATAKSAKAGADAKAGYDALRTVGDLLMTNADFRKLMADVTTISRQVLSDTAHTSAGVADGVAETLKPTTAELEDVNSSVPATGDEFPREENVDIPTKEVGEVLVEGLQETAEAAFDSTKKELEEEGRGDALLQRMKMVVMKLRGNTDYTSSVSILSIVMKHYAITYSRALGETAGTLGDDVETNPELDLAISKFWKLISSFGDANEWKLLQLRWEKFVAHISKDEQFEALVDELSVTVQDVLTDPQFPESADKKMNDIRDLVRHMGTDSTAREDLDALLAQAQITLDSVLKDPDVAQVILTTRRILRNLYPTPYTLNPDLVSDFTHVLVPLAISLIQYIPLLRLTVSTPEVDLLVENLILQPGDTVNTSSFFPHLLRLESFNAFDLRKARVRYTSEMTSLATIKLEGITVRADDVGYFVKAHTGMWRFWDEGIVTVAMDQKGLDLTLDVEIAREKIENLLTLRKVTAKINKLDYNIKQSRYRWLAWPFKPILKPILRRVLRKKIESAIADGVHWVNRELVFARERLRATRVAKPKDMWTFLRAVGARMQADLGGGDAVVGLGAKPAKDESNVLEGRHAPGSIVKVWEEHGQGLEEVLEVEAEPNGGWRNGVFDIRT